MNTIHKAFRTSLLSALVSTLLMASPTKSELDAHKKIVGYFPEWGVYSAHNNYAPSDAPFNKITHINYAFARIIEGEIAIFDDWAATGISFNESWDSPYKGNLGQFKKLKSTYPDTSILISVGGWTQSGGFHDVALDEASRVKFANSCVKFIRQWGFDGVDIDWEFPTQKREPDLVDNASDTGTPKADANERYTFTLLLKTLRETLDKAGEEDHRYYQLTAAVGASETMIQNLETQKYHKYLDFINLMSYDMHGAWESKTNHQSPLYTNPNIDDPYKLTIDHAVELMKQAGVPAYKIVIGSPYYSRGWSGVKDDGPIADLPGLYATATSGAKGIWDGGRAAGVNPYYHIKAQMESDSSFVKYRDPYTKTPYLYSKSRGEMYTYEDEISIKEKADYVNANALGGVIFWELSADYPSKGSSLTTVLFNTLLDGIHPTYANTPSSTSSSTSTQSSSTQSSITSSSSSEASNTVDGYAPWQSSTIYFKGDIVSYNGKLYLSQWWNKNNVPASSEWGPWKEWSNIDHSSSSISSTTSYSSSSMSSSNTTSSIDATNESSSSLSNEDTIAPWSATQIYTKGMYVEYNGRVFMAQWWTRGEAPSTKAWGVWKWVENIEQEALSSSSDSYSSSASLTSSSSSLTSQSSSAVATYTNTFDSTKIYLKGDRVSFNGYIYEAQWWTRGDKPTGEPYTVWKQVGEDDGSLILSSSSAQNSSASSSSEPSIGSYSISKASLDATEASLTNSTLFKEVKASIATRSNSEVETIAPLLASNPSNVKRVERIVSSADWEYLFSQRDAAYTYENFLKAVGKFPAFCGEYDDGRDSDSICRRSLATMFAHFTQETGGHNSYAAIPQWRQGLVYLREVGWDESMRGGYNGECNPNVWQGKTWPCGTFEDGEFKSYFGRGAKQLSYNYNYGPFSEAMTGDIRTLLDNPELVADTWYNLASAVFFFLYPQPPKPSMLHVIDGTWQPNSNDIASNLTPGFGVTTQIINGGVECGGSVEVAQSLNRIEYYQNFAAYLGVTISDDEVLGCKGMQQFDSNGVGALNIYWEQDWSYNASNPEGKSFACKLVGYQTPYSAFKEGDYAKCVAEYFDVTITN